MNIFTKIKIPMIDRMSQCCGFTSTKQWNRNTVRVHIEGSETSGPIADESNIDQPILQTIQTILFAVADFYRHPNVGIGAPKSANGTRNGIFGETVCRRDAQNALQLPSRLSQFGLDLAVKIENTLSIREEGPTERRKFHHVQFAPKKGSPPISSSSDLI